MGGKTEKIDYLSLRAVFVHYAWMYNSKRKELVTKFTTHSKSCEIKQQ